MSTETAALPRWTREQLVHRLVAGCGVTRTGAPDSAAAAVLLKVSRRTLRRWEHGDPAQVVGMTPHNRERVFSALRPNSRVLRQEELDQAYAHEAIRKLGRARRKGILPQWREQRWLEPHLVGVLELPAAHAQQLTVTRIDSRPMHELHRRGELTDITRVPTKFHATVLSVLVLDLVNPWRVQLASGFAPQGHTLAWTTDAPSVDLAALAVTNDLR